MFPCLEEKKNPHFTSSIHKLLFIYPSQFSQQIWKRVSFHLIYQLSGNQTLIPELLLSPLSQQVFPIISILTASLQTVVLKIQLPQERYTNGERSSAEHSLPIDTEKMYIWNNNPGETQFGMRSNNTTWLLGTQERHILLTTFKLSYCTSKVSKNVLSKK